MKYTVKLVRREEVAAGTMAFWFEKPAGFEFVAGQNCDWILTNPPETDAEGNIRPFSLASAPHEPELIIATRMRDTAFKRVLKNMPPGGEVEMKGPGGDFVLHNDVSKPAIMLAGGIGITPFRSIILDAEHSGKSHQLFLFYSNRRPKDVSFLQELAECSKRYPNFRLIATVTEESDEPWSEEKGYINGPMLKKYLPDLAKPIYYLAGPQAFVIAMRKMLTESGANPDNIRAEEFDGY